MDSPDNKMYCKIQGWISHMGICAQAKPSSSLVKSTVLLKQLWNSMWRQEQSGYVLLTSRL